MFMDYESNKKTTLSFLSIFIFSRSLISLHYYQYYNYIIFDIINICIFEFIILFSFYYI